MSFGREPTPEELARMRKSEVVWGDLVQISQDIPVAGAPVSFPNPTKLNVRVSDVARAWAVRVSGALLTALTNPLDGVNVIFTIHSGIGRARFQQVVQLPVMLTPLSAGFEETVFLPDYPAETLDITAEVLIHAAAGPARNISVRVNAAAAPYTRLRADT